MPILLYDFFYIGHLTPIKNRANLYTLFTLPRFDIPNIHVPYRL